MVVSLNIGLRCFLVPFDFVVSCIKQKNGFVRKKISGRIPASVNRGTGCSHLSAENINLSARFWRI